MINLRSLRVLFYPAIAVCLFANAAQAQLSTTLRLSKSQYLTGEPVLAVVTITNHSGQDLTFYGDGRRQWLDFVVKDKRSEDVSGRAKSAFGKMSIKAGATMAREVDLTQHFFLSEHGNYSVSAVVHMPGNMEGGSSTNRVLFNQSPGSTYWSQKVGIPSRPGMTREYRLINFSGDQKSQMYAQIVDNRSGQYVRTFALGEVMMIRKPLVTVDKLQRMHVMYLATPTMWVHYEVDTDGKVVNRQIHQRGGQGDPQLVTYGDGSVKVANSIVYDAKAEAEARSKMRKASDRPAITY